MVDEIILRFSVKDDGTPVIEKVNKKLGETKKESKALVPGLENARQSMGNFISTNAALIGVLAGVGVALGSVIKEHIEYANAVRQQAAVSGTSTEEASRYIQVLDDYKISAQEALAATRFLTNAGHVPSIQTLAKLSDEYLSLNSDQEKNAFILKNLGRGGLQWVEVLQKGSKALLEQGAAIDKSLILTQRMVDDARKAEIAVDNWGDAIGGLKTQLAVGLLPALTGAVKHTNALMEVDKRMTSEGLVPGSKAWMERRQELLATVKAEQEEAEALMLTESGMKSNAEAIQENEQAMKERLKVMTESNQAMLGLIGEIQSAEENYQQTAADLIEERKQLERDRAEEVAKGWAMDKEKVAEYDLALIENTAKVAENKQAFVDANLEIISGLVERKLMQDGVLTNDEFNWLLQKRQEWGLYSEDVVAKAQAAWQEADRITASIANIPDTKTSTIDIITNHFSNVIGASGGGRAAGGPVTGGTPYMVGERGPEMFVPGQSGNIVPNNALNNGAIDYKKMARAIRDAMRQVGG
jgi:NADH:ubiquinone oxidoreductase subunit E